MSDRFEYVQRFRYGVDRDLTGAIGVFVGPSEAGTALRVLRDDPSRVGSYVWTRGLEPHNSEP